MQAVARTRRVVMALFFYPRGGSSNSVRQLANALPGVGWQVTLVAGSLGGPDEISHAPTFFGGLRPSVVDYTAARNAVDPLDADPPFQPSYEDRPGASDQIFAAVGDRPYQRLVAAWELALGHAGAAEADVLHLHHLTPVNEAAARAFPKVPRLGQLHGTELLMLEELEASHPNRWPHADAWSKRLRRWANACDRLLVPSEDAANRTARLLGVDRARMYRVPNAVDVGRFYPRLFGTQAREELWRQWLVRDPQGWDGSGIPGSVRYREEDLAAFRDGAPVVLYVGRFTAVKRIPLLIRAYARARPRFIKRAPLVLLGGFPGEVEGRHPLDEVHDLGVPDVFLAGWREHSLLPQGFSAADVLVLPSVREQFGQVVIEAMACGLSVIAVNAYGPASIVEPGRTGWLVGPDDEKELAEALVEAVNDPVKRTSMGMEACDVSRSHYSLPAVAEAVACVYERMTAG